MKVLNVVLSVLILLLAVASAVFAFFLFEKREQMTEGWKKMSETIYQTAMKLDKDSGTTVASELTVEKLSHLNYQQMLSLLGKLPQQAGQIVDERNALGQSLLAVAQTVRMQNVPQFDALTKVDSSMAAQTAIVDQVNRYKNQSDDINAKVAQAAGRMQAKVTAAELASSDYNSAFSRFFQRIDEVNKQVKDFQAKSEQIASAIGAPGGKIDEANYAASLDQILQRGLALKHDYDTAISDIRGRDKQIADYMDEVKGLNLKIEELNVTMDQKNDEIQRLVQVIDPASGGKKPDIWEPGALEARKVLQGRVLEVNDKFGVIVVDLGKNTRVKQLVGRNRVDVNPEIPVGATMMVVRDFAEKPRYIGQVKLVRVEDNCSVAELLGDKEQKVRVGDTVVFSDSDLAALVR